MSRETKTAHPQHAILSIPAVSQYPAAVCVAVHPLVRWDHTNLFTSVTRCNMLQRQAQIKMCHLKTICGSSETHVCETSELKNIIQTRWGTVQMSQDANAPNVCRKSAWRDCHDDLPFIRGGGSEKNDLIIPQTIFIITIYFHPSVSKTTVAFQVR